MEEDCTHLYGVIKMDSYYGILFLQKDPEETHYFYKDNPLTTIFKYCPDCGTKLEE